MNGPSDRPIIHLRPDALLRSVFVALIVATALAAAAKLSSGMSSREVASFDPRCEHLDNAAAAVLAKLIFDHDEIAQMQVRHGLMRLRRARLMCQYGGSDMARRDYEAVSVLRRDARR